MFLFALSLKALGDRSFAGLLKVALLAFLFALSLKALGDRSCY